MSVSNRILALLDKNRGSRFMLEEVYNILRKNQEFKEMPNDILMKSADRALSRRGAFVKTHDESGITSYMLTPSSPLKFKTVKRICEDTLWLLYDGTYYAVAVNLSQQNGANKTTLLIRGRNRETRFYTEQEAVENAQWAFDKLIQSMFPNPANGNYMLVGFPVIRCPTVRYICPCCICTMRNITKQVASISIVKSYVTTILCQAASLVEAGVEVNVTADYTKEDNYCLTMKDINEVNILCPSKKTS